jgi:phospholipid/cholesterol/gamma-HCH transport system substrate-binding protein
VTRSLSFRQAVLLGLTILAGAGLGAAGLFLVGSRGWFGEDALHVRAGFADVRGVEVGTRVRIQGIDAGEVVAVTPPANADGQVILRLRLKGEYRHLVRASSTVQIVSEGMLGAKVLEIHRKPGPSPLAREDQLLESERSTELADVLQDVRQTLEGIRDGDGTLGKLARDPTLYRALLDTVHQGKETLASAQRTTDAVKRLPLVGGYIEDPEGLLIRPRFERNRQFFAEHELFEPGRAVLTAQGRGRLDALAPWLEGLKHDGSEVVVVSYADPDKATGRLSRQVTGKQSEAVVEYLEENHKVQKLGWFSSRKVIPLGMGDRPPPRPEKEPLPPARVEVLVFVPQG